METKSNDTVSGTHATTGQVWKSKSQEEEWRDPFPTVSFSVAWKQWP